MLDHFTILTQGGLVLWSRSFTPSPSPFDTLIREALIEERSSSTSTCGSSAISTWSKDGYALLWTLANELDLVFVVAYQRILQLTYVEELLARVKEQFMGSFRSVIEGVVESTKGKDVGGALHGVIFGGQGWKELFKGWEDTFARLLRELEMGAAKNKRRVTTAVVPDELSQTADAGDAQAPTLAGSETVGDAQSIARNISALKARQKAAAKGKGSKVVKGTESESAASSGTESPNKKAPTKWADSKVTAADLASYDYSSDVPSSGASTPLPAADILLSSSALGKTSKAGLYEVADFLSPTATTASKGGMFSSLLSALSLSPKNLTAADLAPALAAMNQHLMAKNVAKEIADKVCESVGKSLEGKKVGGLLETVKGEVRKAMEASLVKILTPKSSTDLLLDITRKKANSALISSSQRASTTTNVSSPYTITFVGVNGVGKSTNLSKVAFWLLQNKQRVLIAACDTFRSGAVEQLRTHVRNLGRLGDELSGSGADGKEGEGKGSIELFERGYGKDAAGIAKDAIAFGKANGFDVVLIDTAGRMQDNEPLMRALAKLVTVNNPDKIIFVGEALAGNEAVDQLTGFNRSLRDFSGTSTARGIDGMILTKFDTIDDKVGAALSMTYVTGQPILFVGTGQTYSDLRSLRVAHIVQALLND